MDLEAGRFSGVEALLKEVPGAGEEQEAHRAYVQALYEFYQGHLEAASQTLSRFSSSTAPSSSWLKNYCSELLPVHSQMERSESDHFILKTVKGEKFLSGYALEALEKSYQEVGAELKWFPQEKIQVEIYPTQESFSKASTLSPEILERSGAIGICKFRRLMILSPGQLAFGYRWLDTLSHEYVHYLVNVVGAGKSPLWLNEGIAKYLESRWRLKEPQFLTPGNRTELLEALKSDRLIPFSRMEPSMVYLENQAQVRQAFSQVAHAVHAIQKMKGKDGISQVLKGLAAGEPRETVFQSVFRAPSQTFEESWKEFLEKEDLQESPGAAPDKIRIGKNGDEIEEFTGTGVREHIRLGDRMRQNGQLQVAAIQYRKALKREVHNPVALTKLSRVLIQLGQVNAAIPHLKTCIEENPNFVSAYLILGEQMIREKNWDQALWCALEANAINPFNPEVHRRLSEIYQNTGKQDQSQREQEIFNQLQ